MSVAIAPAVPIRRVGRFELKRELGRGAQATVWLAFDARLEREVAVKLMHAGAAEDPIAVGHWLREARSSSRLAHPNIVPVFEADLHDQQPYLVFEYVPGPTLAQQLKSRGPAAPREAVTTMLGVLDALSAAHAAGIVHRDLKPSNILVDSAGRARVMDFGIAARLNDPGSLDQIVGTPGYMSPEAADGGLPAATMDVFAAGLVLIELLGGERVVAERDPYRAMIRVSREDLVLPASLPRGVDDALRAALARAIERDPARRWPDAASFRDALAAWLAPPVVEPSAAVASSASGTLEFLLRRMRHRSDFPALSDSVARIQKVAASDTESIGSLAGEIMKDVALTQKLLRLVNTAHYSGAGGNVGTVSRAIALIGFAGVRNMAISLVLLEHMHDKAHAERLREDFMRSLMAGMLASELGAASRECEEAFIGAMFQNLGRMLGEFYLPDEAAQVRGLMAGSSGQPDSPSQGEETASGSVLGVTYQALGLGVARSWGLPASLQACMQRPSGEPPSRLLGDPVERLRWLTTAANRITDAMLHTEPARARSKVAELARVFARPLGLTAAAIEASTAAAQTRLAQVAGAMNLHFAPQSPARRLLAGRSAGATIADTAVATGHQPESHASTVDAAKLRAADRTVACDVLSAGIQDITNSMAEDVTLNEVLKMILGTMYRALDFRRVVFCLRDAKTQGLSGRFGLGEGAAQAAPCFKVMLAGSRDLFSAVCMKGADTVITDAGVATVSARLPDWFRNGIAAPTFLLLPLLIKGAPFAMIYADKASAGSIVLDEKELSLLRTLRNQAVMAFRQAR